MATLTSQADSGESGNQGQVYSLKPQVQHVELETETPKTQKSVFRPRFEHLPLRNGDPPYSAWGLWGDDDEAGSLNLITPDVVAEAATEIREGLRLSLNWSLNMPKTPGFGRSNYVFSHTLHAGPPGLTVFDDTLTFNTQKSTQWDGLRHFAYQSSSLFYNNTPLSAMTSPDSTKLGIHNFNKIGGIATRALPLDYHAYALAHEISTSPMTDSISFQSLMACLEWQSAQSGAPITITPGTILLIRSGYHSAYSSLTPSSEKALGEQLPPQTGGARQDLGMLKWIWESQFAAVGGDSVGFESFPGKPEAGWLFHEVLIAGWGMPIAEMLWLEDLSKECARRNRWTCFVSSCPLNVEGGVASPANMVAIL